MKIAFLHLSDIHIVDQQDFILQRVNDIASAASSVWNEVQHLIIIITGDIAFSGQVPQYKLAVKFLNTLKAKISSQLGNIKIHIVAIPGNHDCDFSFEPDLRKAAVEKSFVLFGNGEKLDVTNELIKKSLQVQRNFFKFCTILEPELNYPSSPKVFYQLKIDTGQAEINFNCINSAWCSQLKESQGELYFPTEWLNPENNESSNKLKLNVSLFHHPYNWLEANNSLLFRQKIENCSDIVLTGHEHTSNFFLKSKPAEKNLQYIEATSLQENPKLPKSEFHLLIVDLDENQQKLLRFRWQNEDSIYKEFENIDWFPFTRNCFLVNQGFVNLPAFETELQDIGLALKHGRKRNPTLDDLFVYPRLLGVSINEIIRGNRNGTPIDSEKVADFLFNQKYVIALGGTLSGKTTLAKALYLESKKRELIPILISGSQFSNSDENAFEKSLIKVFTSQYVSDELWLKFKGIPKEKRVLIIDDLHTFKQNQIGIHELLKHSQKHFGTVIAIADEDYRMQQMSQDNTAKGASMIDVEYCWIKDFNKRQRGELIRRWIRLGNDLISSVEDLIREEDVKERSIDKLISCGLPSSPIFILGALQVNDGHQMSPNGQLGSYGYLFQGLVTERLSKLQKDPTEIDQYNTILGMIAFKLFEKDNPEITQEDVKDFVAEYQREYKTPINSDQLIIDLDSARLWSFVNYGKKSIYRFAHPYLKYYFTALHLSTLLNDEDPEIQKNAGEFVNNMVQHITYDPYSRVLLFLVYFANNRARFIRDILNESKLIYKDSQPTDLDTDIEFLNNLNQDRSKLRLLAGTIPENRDKQREVLDDFENDHQEQTEQHLTGNSILKYDDSLDPFTKTSMTLRMIELLGQILLNFPGSLKGPMKEELAKESIDLGLRLLKAFFNDARENWNDWRLIFGELIKENSLLENEEEGKENSKYLSQDLPEKTDRLLLWLTKNMSYGVLKKISQSIGHEKLKQTFVDIAGSNSGQTSYELVDAAIRLDNYVDPRFNNIIELAKKLKDNQFAWEILRILVGNHMLFFPVTVSNLQRLCSTFEISYADEKSKFLVNEDKKRLLSAIDKSKKRKRRNKNRKFNN